MKTANIFHRLALATLAATLIMSLSLVLNSAANAQGRGGKRGPVNSEVRLNRAMTYWTQQLNLTSEQQTQFRSVLQVHFAKRDSLRGTLRGNRQAMQSQMASVRNTTHASLAQILTPDQQKNFVPLWNKRGGQMNGRNWNN